MARSAAHSGAPSGAPLPLWSDAAAFRTAFLDVPAAMPWAALTGARWPYLEVAPPGFAAALLAPPPWPPQRHPLGPREVAAALAAQHAKAPQRAEDAWPGAAAQRPPSAPPAAPTPPPVRVFSRQQLLELQPASTPRPPELDGHPAALQEALPPAPPPAPPPPPPAVAPAVVAAPPLLPPPPPPPPPGPARYTASQLLQLRRAATAPAPPDVLAAVATLQGVTHAPAPSAAARPAADAADTDAAADAPLPPLLPACGLWLSGDAEAAAEGAWSEETFLEDVAALPAAAAALAPPPPAAAAALRFADGAALRALCRAACAQAAREREAPDAAARAPLLHWALLRGAPPCEPDQPAVVTAMQLWRGDAPSLLTWLVEQHTPGHGKGAESALDALPAVVGWAACTLGTGPFLPSAALAAFAARDAGGAAQLPSPAAAALFACIDATRSAHGPPALECYDLRRGLPLGFQLPREQSENDA